MSPAGQYGVVLTEVPRVLDQCDGNSRARHQFTADLHRPVVAAIVDEDDFVSAVNAEGLDVMDQRRNGFRGVVHGDDERESDGHQTGSSGARRPVALMPAAGVATRGLSWKR